MKAEVHVAAVQMDVAWLKPKNNLETMVRQMDQIVAQRSVDLVVFPELANTGYVRGRDLEFAKQYIACAEPIPGPTTDTLGELASRHSVYIVVGLCQLHPEIPAMMYNSAALIGPTGLIGVHHKAHLPIEENHYFCPGNALNTFKTELGKLGMLVCYDAVFPEAARILALRGAEIICAPFNAMTLTDSTYSDKRIEYYAGLRALENKVFFITCNRVGKEEDTRFIGKTTIAGPDGEILAQAESQAEEVVWACLEQDLLIHERASLPVFRDRRPDLYGPIVERP